MLQLYQTARKRIASIKGWFDTLMENLAIIVYGQQPER